jgi:hypothetical protein
MQYNKGFHFLHGIRGVFSHSHHPFFYLQQPPPTVSASPSPSTSPSPEDSRGQHPRVQPPATSSLAVGSCARALPGRHRSPKPPGHCPITLPRQHKAGAAPLPPPPPRALRYEPPMAGALSPVCRDVGRTRLARMVPSPSPMSSMVEPDTPCSP